MLKLEELFEIQKLLLMGCQEYPGIEGVCYWGGMGEVVKAISERLIHKGYEVLVLPRLGNGKKNGVLYQEKNGVHVLSMPSQSFQGGETSKDLYSTYQSNENDISLDHSFTTWKYLKKKGFKVGIVHYHDWLGAGWGREAQLAGLKRIFTIHMSQEREKMRNVDKRLEVERLAGEDAQIIHYVSENQFQSCKTYNWSGSKKHIVIPNGVDLMKFIPGKANLEKEYVLFVGRLEPIKNAHNLVKGWAEFNKQYKDCELKILGAPGSGSGLVQQAISSLPKEQQKKVELIVKMVPENERITYFQDSTICCFPSSAEAFGIVALEAQACEKPVVVGNVGGFKENVFEGITGIHVDGGNPSDIARGLKAAYCNKETWGINGRKSCKDFFDWNKITQRYIDELYEVS